MRKILLIFFTLFLLPVWGGFFTSHASAAEIQANGEYYIWLNIYEKLLGTNEEGTGPAISAFGTKEDADSYIFVAEESGKSGYWLLRQKSSGKYLAASSANSWSTTLEDRSTADRFCWSFSEGAYTYLKSKSGSYLGIDGANKGKTYVAVYYDKPKGSHSQFSVIPTAGGTWTEARQAYESEVYTNAQGVNEIDYCQISGKTIDCSDAIDIHITSNDNPISGSSSINLGSDRTWLIFDNIQPSTVVSNYLKYVKINGVKAANNSNCRVAIFLNGAAVIPLPKPVMQCSGTDGDFTLAVGNHSDLKTQSNTMTSFVLRRGYMATVASGTKGSGYSRVYVADHADLEVTLPKALAKRVSSVNVKNWQYVSKKGWGSTSGANGGGNLRATWFWSWSAGYSSTTDMEYVPCRQHLYWPSASDVNSKTATASLSLNEPEHSEQHTSSKCSCGGTIDEWKAYTINDDFLPGGGRIGSPQPTAFSYLTKFCTHVDNMSSRCDFVVTHAYWDTEDRNEKNYADWFANECKTIYNNTGRPVWLTEMEVGSSWGTKMSSYEEYRKYLQVLLQKIEECDYIERYVAYPTDVWTTYLYYEANPSKGLTPAGQVYRDHRSTFAYHAKYTKEPTWWKPGIKAPTLSYTINAEKQEMVFTLGNTNGDYTQTLVLERKREGGAWEVIYEITDRSKFDQDTFTYNMPLSDGDRDSDLYRLTCTTIFDETANSEDLSTSYIRNADCTEGTEGWTVSNLSTNTGEAYDGEAGNAYWNQWKASGLNSSMTQTCTGLRAGDYVLSALLRGGSNVSIELKAEVLDADGNPVTGKTASQTIQGTGNSTVTGSDYQNGWQLVTLSSLSIAQGEQLRITATATGSGSAWWSADHFSLDYTPLPDGIDTFTIRSSAESKKIYDLQGRSTNSWPFVHGFFIQNGKKIIK